MLVLYTKNFATLYFNNKMKIRDYSALDIYNILTIYSCVDSILVFVIFNSRRFLVYAF